jgi:hypothetical protein
MAARKWILLALGGGAVAVPACALVLGAEELPEGTGGAGGAAQSASTIASTSSQSSSGSHASSSSSSSQSSSGSHASSSSSSSQSSSASSTASSSSSAGGACATSATCQECIECFSPTGCKSQLATCNADAGCGDYFACVIQCPEDGGFGKCAAGPMGCNGMPDMSSDYLDLKSCVCTGCKVLCPGLCP